MKLEGGEDVIDGIDIIMLVLSVYLMGTLIIETFLGLPPAMISTLETIDDGICIIFFLEFLYQLWYTKNKWGYMKWGWIDLLSAMPIIHSVSYDGVIRIIRLVRVVKAFKAITHFTNHMFGNKSKGTFITVVVFSLLIVVFSAIAVLMVETDPTSNIKTAEDALWWAYVTITTVGYGDKFPVTSAGRIVGVVLMTAGVGLFGTFTAFLSALFLKDHKVKDKDKIESPS